MRYNKGGLALITAKTIRETTFKKAMSGYKPAEVAAFLAEAADYAASLESQKSELEDKIFALAERVEQYRREEDSMKERVQKLREAISAAKEKAEVLVQEARDEAASTVAEARRRGEQILTEMRGRGDVALAEVQTKITREQFTLTHLQKEVADFKARVLALYKAHLESISTIGSDRDRGRGPIEAHVDAHPFQIPAEPPKPAAAEAPGLGEEPSARPAPSEGDGAPAPSGLFDSITPRRAPWEGEPQTDAQPETQDVDEDQGDVKNSVTAEIERRKRELRASFGLDGEERPNGTFVRERAPGEDSSDDIRPFKFGTAYED